MINNEINTNKYLKDFIKNFSQIKINENDKNYDLVE